LAAGVVSLTGIRNVEAQSVDLVLKVELGADRDQTGHLRLETAGGRRLAGPFIVYGRADTAEATRHQNPTRSPTLPYGDTPVGTYEIPRVIRTGPDTPYNNRSYGPNGALVLKPTGGEASVAALNGRVGLLVHGGASGRGGKLRATHGCLRLSNADVAALIAAIAAAGNNPRFNRCDVVRLNATVGETADPVCGEDAGDPPPGIADLLQPGPIRLP